VSAPSLLYQRHRFPPEIISFAVYLYYRFTISYRDVKELRARRGIVVSYETIRRWCLKFGSHFAAEIRRRRPQPKTTWHLDEMYIKMNGRTWYLWRAVDAEGLELDIVLQESRNQAAAEVLLRRLVEDQPTKPRVIITDKLASYIPAIKKVFPQVEHRAHMGLNKRP
jgi:putative transposase